MVATGLLNRIGRLRDGLESQLVSPARYLYEGTLMKVLRRRGQTIPLRICLVSDGSEITSEEQFNPFRAYRSELRRQLGVISLKTSLRDVLRSPHTCLSPFDIIILKLSFRKPQSEALAIVKAVRSATSAPLIYFDGDDDLGVQWPELLPLVELYVKKHVFHDRGEYMRSRVGKSNLTDYVHATFGDSFAEDPISAYTESVPADQVAKIVAVTNVALDRKILDLYQRVNPRSMFTDERNIDLIFRGSVPDDWMGKLRRPIGPALEMMRNRYRVVTPNTRVTPEEYYRELASSKICLSPFGYGEICWRDFEAVLCGALLVKPDMSHVETTPNLFRPLETYVSVRWDFSDLQEKCAYYLKHEDERLKITRRAFETLDDFYKSKSFVRSFANLLDRIR